MGFPIVLDFVGNLVSNLLLVSFLSLIFEMNGPFYSALTAPPQCASFSPFPSIFTFFPFKHPKHEESFLFLRSISRGFRRLSLIVFFLQSFEHAFGFIPSVVGPLTCALFCVFSPKWPNVFLYVRRGKRRHHHVTSSSLRSERPNCNPAASFAPDSYTEAPFPPI